MSFTRFCLLLQPYLARQAKRIFQEHRPELDSVRDSSLQRASSLGAASGAGAAVPHDGREPSERSDSGWENVRRAFFPFPLWRPRALRRRRSSALAR